MRRPVYLALALVISLSLASARSAPRSQESTAQQPAAPSLESKVVTAAQINGTWRNKQNEFRIWALGHQQLKVEFSGVYAYNSPQGPTANTGEGSGSAHIDGDTISFKPDVSEAECSITLKYATGRLRVSQTGVCGFGYNVTADGIYRRVSARKPKFLDQ